MAAIDVDYTVTGSGPAIFMAHGIGGRRSGWDDIVAGLKDDFTCITYDQRGHGTSPIPPVPYSLDELVSGSRGAACETRYREGACHRPFPGRHDRAGLCAHPS